MKERPILMKGKLVQGILARFKTQTRRVVRPERPFDTMESSVWDYLDDADASERLKATSYCPHGVVGDRLWVRETWCQKADRETGKLIDGYHYQADGYEVRHVDGGQTKNGYERSPWRPSIYMPRAACRLVLTIEEVRVERLQNITGPSAFNELGYDPHGTYVTDFGWELREFAKFWDKLNAKRGFGWDTNPWVWVLHFRADEVKR